MTYEELEKTSNELKFVVVNARSFKELLDKAFLVATTPEAKLAGDQKSRLSLSIQSVLASAKPH